MFCSDNLRQAMADLEEHKAFEDAPTVASSEDEEEEEEGEKDWNDTFSVGFEHPKRYLPYLPYALMIDSSLVACNMTIQTR